MNFTYQNTQGFGWFFGIFLIPSPTISTDAGDAKAESGARNHLSQPGAAGDVKENGEDFFWHLNVENMGQDHIIWNLIWKISVYHSNSYYILMFFVKLLDLGCAWPHGTADCDQSVVFYLVIMNHIL